MSVRHTIAIAGLVAFLMAGCTAPAVRPSAEPVADGETVLVDGFVQISAGSEGIGDETAARLRAAAAGRGPVGVVRGLVTAPTPGRRLNSVVQALSMQAIEPVVMIEPEATDIEVTIFRTVQSGCPDWANARLSRPTDWLLRQRNPYPADELGLGCTLQASLDAMVADPSDLTDPPRRMSAAHAAGLAAASERYRTTGPRELPERQSAVSAF